MDTGATHHSLYPSIAPFETGMLRPDGHHALYWEQSGNSLGIPVVVLHGGPGSGTNPLMRRFFNPEVYRIILIDQRGSGRSTPFASIENNTTPDLVNDLELLRKHLGIDRWVLFGGSWGSTLALCYAITHPEQCLGLILRGIFLARSVELEWFLGGIARVFPEPWEALCDHLPEEERSDLLASYYKRLSDPDPEIHMPAAHVWNQFETDCSTLTGYAGPTINSQSLTANNADKSSLPLSRLEVHYFINNFFFDENYILDNVGKMKHLPGFIVQGRYDMICPAQTAYELSKVWPKADCKMIPTAGHSSMENGIKSALVHASDQMIIELVD